MEVEHVAGVGFAARRTAQQQRHLAVGHSLFGKVVVNHQRRATRIAEILADGGTREGRKKLHGGRIGRPGGHDDGVIHRTRLAQGLLDLLDGRGLLPAGDVNAVDGLAFVVKLALINDSIDGHGRFAGLTVANDEFALTAPDGNHSVDGLDARLEGFVDRLTVDHAGSFALQGHFKNFARDRPKAVDGFAEGIDHPAQNAFSDFDTGNFVGALHDGPFHDFAEIAEQHGPHVVFFEVQSEGFQAIFKDEQFARLNLRQPVDAGHPVADLQHGAHLFEFGLGFCIG